MWVQRTGEELGGPATLRSLRVALCRGHSSGEAPLQGRLGRIHLRAGTDEAPGAATEGVGGSLLGVQLCDCCLLTEGPGMGAKRRHESKGRVAEGTGRGHRGASFSHFPLSV